ncbi:MAG: hypothetical protein AAF847_11355 [Bacteroidota bacterium]
MLKVLKWIGIVLLVLIIGVFIFLKASSQPKPTGETGEQADQLAQKMLAAVDQTAWDSTRYVQWTFAGMHDYFWDKERHLVEVKWSDKTVLLNPNEISGKAWEGDAALEGDAADKLVKKAWSFFVNDGFWLNAPVKAFDVGTSRSIVQLEDGSEGLMVSYASGGLTPGDSYLWLLDENGLPTAWKMWIKVIPIGGIESSWEAWTTLSTGAKVATQHKTKGITLELTNVKAGQTLAAMGRSKDVFAALTD